MCVKKPIQQAPPKHPLRELGLKYGQQVRSIGQITGQTTLHPGHASGICGLQIRVKLHPVYVAQLPSKASTIPLTDLLGLSDETATRH
jgi:hypothetical protein